jgi:hypothetical protein
VTIEQLKAQLMQCAYTLRDACEPMQQGHEMGYTAYRLLQAAMEGTTQSDSGECSALIANVMQQAGEAAKGALLAAERAEQIAARL